MECFLRLDEHTFLVTEEDRETAAYPMDQEPENWHALPLSIAERPMIPAF